MTKGNKCLQGDVCGFLCISEYSAVVLEKINEIQAVGNQRCAVAGKQQCVDFSSPPLTLCKLWGAWISDIRMSKVFLSVLT